MATLLHRVMQNFDRTIKAISPTSEIVRNKFLFFDPDFEEPAQNTGGFRWFFVDWSDSDPPGQATDSDNREHWHRAKVKVHYRKKVIPFLDAREMILLDRHDLISALRDDNKAGYDGDNPTTDLGLKRRIHDGDEMTEDDEFRFLTMQFRCKVREAE